MIFVVTVYPMIITFVYMLFCSYIAMLTTKHLNNTYVYMSTCLLPYT